jgi:hypothetical protein
LNTVSSSARLPVSQWAAVELEQRGQPRRCKPSPCLSVEVGFGVHKATAVPRPRCAEVTERHCPVTPVPPKIPLSLSVAVAVGSASILARGTVTVTSLRVSLSAPWRGPGAAQGWRNLPHCGAAHCDSRKGSACSSKSSFEAKMLRNVLWRRSLGLATTFGKRSPTYHLS